VKNIFGAISEIILNKMLSNAGFEYNILKREYNVAAFPPNSISLP
jgi:hypothetical protein